MSSPLKPSKRSMLLTPDFRGCCELLDMEDVRPLHRRIPTEADQCRVELPLSIIVGCLPTLRPLFRPGAFSPLHDSADAVKMCPRKVGSLTDQTELSIQDNKICHTTTISVVTAQRSSKDNTPKHNMWTVDEGV